MDYVCHLVSKVYIGADVEFKGRLAVIGKKKHLFYQENRKSSMLTKPLHNTCMIQTAPIAIVYSMNVRNSSIRGSSNLSTQSWRHSLSYLRV